MRCAKYGFTLFILVLILCMTGTGYSQVQEGKQVPLFSLKGMDGKTYDLSQMKDRPMMIIYFFDAASRPSQESLLTMDNLAKKYQDADLRVWGITRSPKDSVADFVKKTNPAFPILLDDAAVSDAYQAKFILPTTCIMGPDLTLLDYFQGGGKTTNVMLVKLAERKLQQKEVVLAQALSDEAVKNDPKDAKAQMIKGYAALKAGQLDDAEKTFAAMTAEKGQGEILGKEGLASVYAAKGQSEKALAMASAVENAAPERAYIHAVKGDVLYAQDKKAQAQAEYAKAVQNPGAEDFQKAGAYNKLGRLYASIGDYQQSRDLYDQAVRIDPYYVEAMANKGVTYEKEGNWDKALDMYNKGQSLDKDDVFASALARRAAQMIALQNDAKNRERIDKLVEDLSKRYRSQKKIFTATTEDTWTSRPMVLTFVDFQETGALSERDGISVVLATQLADELNASGRVQVVERVVIER
ncbi:MAG TPA: redoxin domain-containing protein, partial [Deltaproteobacteria bacterium]|nr:redoxin domain-containing protein [Deltaproteobacteria bacterium]